MNKWLMLFNLIALVATVAGLWKIFEKAGRKPWLSLIPIYNGCVLFQIAGKSPWLMLLAFIPIVNFVVWILLALDLSKVFGKGNDFALGLILLTFIFLPILGFGDAQYDPQRQPDANY